MSSVSGEQCHQEDGQSQAIDEESREHGNEQAPAAKQQAEACQEHVASLDGTDTCKDQHTVASSREDNAGHSEHTDCFTWPAGYYYQDSEGNTQGPCSLQDLQSLQACFPEAAHMVIWAGDGAGGGYSAQLHEVLHWASPKQQQQQHAWASRPASASLSSRYSGDATTDAAAQPAQCAYAEAVLAGVAHPCAEHRGGDACGKQPTSFAQRYCLQL